MDGPESMLRAIISVEGSLHGTAAPSSVPVFVRYIIRFFLNHFVQIRPGALQHFFLDCVPR